MAENEVKIEEAKTTQSKGGLKAVLPLVFTAAGYLFLFLEYLLFWAIKSSRSAQTCRIIFFALSFACTMTSVVYNFLVNKQTKPDLLTIFNALAIYLCF